MNQAESARLLYTLLDAAEDDGRLRHPAVADKWRALKQRFDNPRCEPESAALQALLDELDRSGALAGSWVQARWLEVKRRSAGGLASCPESPGSGLN